MRPNAVKRALREGRPVVGTWLSLGSVTAARFLARMGFDYLTVDVEHSLVNVETTTHMIGSIADAGCVPLVRVPSNRHDHIKRVLDNGGYGIVVPMVMNRTFSSAESFTASSTHASVTTTMWLSRPSACVSAASLRASGLNSASSSAIARSATWTMSGLKRGRPLIS